MQKPNEATDSKEPQSVSRVLGFFCARDTAVGVGTVLRVTGQFPAESA
jgi:hypothetical protein